MIKEEITESDSEEHNCMPKTDVPKRNDTLNIKAIITVKSEIEEISDDDNTMYQDDADDDIIQIISESVDKTANIKKPCIEIVSENTKDIKENLSDDNFDDYEDVKEVLDEEDPLQQKFFNPKAVVDMKLLDEDAKSVLNVLKDLDPSNKLEKENSVPKRKKRTKINKKSKQMKEKSLIKKKKSRIKEDDSDYEVDEKFLFLGENEICDIDIEEMEAVIKKKENPNAVFECNRCAKVFKFFKALRKHRRLIHEVDRQPLKCKMCTDEKLKDFEFSSLHSLKGHIFRKHSYHVKKYRCNLCCRSWTTMGQLNSHNKRVHDTSEAPCQKCGKVFKNRSRLTDHMKVHITERPFVCDLCGHSFKWSSALKVHIQSHKQEKNFLCSDCGKKFSSKKNLVEHLNIHTGIRPHKCKHCNASFSQPAEDDNLVVEIRI